MDIQSLKTFITLAETKSYTKTANQLFVAQSTVTNRINELERELKLSLFSRTNRRGLRFMRRRCWTLQRILWRK